MTVRHLDCDFLIIGGGIAGLWILDRLRRAGFNAVLLEKDALGQGQSMRSQGIIHGGIKFALNGILTPAANAIATMPERWRQALKGQDEVDLSGVTLLSDYHYMWSKGSFASSLTTFFASKAVRSRMFPVKEAQLPAAFAGSGKKVYALCEPVIDMHSLFTLLAKRHHGHCLRLDATTGSFELDGHGRAQAWLQALPEGDNLRISFQRCILSAGEGNARLCHSLGASAQPVAMQLRPLHQILVRHRGPRIYAHCVGNGSKPEVTVTSHPRRDGSVVWSLGGNLAEEGVQRSEPEQIEAARQLLSSLLPWIKLEAPQFTSFRVNRAEPATRELVRPDSAFLQEMDKVLLAWPTKLALAPHLSDEVFAHIRRDGLKPGVCRDTQIAGLPLAEAAVPVWESSFP